jgi:hypothetical protein
LLLVFYIYHSTPHLMATATNVVRIGVIWSLTSPHIQGPCAGAPPVRRSSQRVMCLSCLSSAHSSLLSPGLSPWPAEGKGHNHGQPHYTKQEHGLLVFPGGPGEPGRIVILLFQGLTSCLLMLGFAASSAAQLSLTSYFTFSSA